MGQVGRWIDGLSDEQRDRIIEHPDPTFHGSWWWDETRRCGCLVGCVVEPEVDTTVSRGNYGAMHCAIVGKIHTDPETEEVGMRFPNLTERFGPERIWRAVKLRAARGNRIPEAPEPAIFIHHPQGVAP